MNKKVQRVTVTSTIGVVALLGLAVPAQAGVQYESGTKSCRSGEYPGMQLKGQDGQLYTKPPGRGTFTYEGTYWEWKIVQEGWSGSGGYWQGKVEGDNPRVGAQETYPYCTP